MFWGILLIAIGVGALLDISLWPVVLIAIGAGLLLSRLARGSRGRDHWFGPCNCWPFQSEPTSERESSADRNPSQRMV